MRGDGGGSWQAERCTRTSFQLDELRPRNNQIGECGMTRCLQGFDDKVGFSSAGVRGQGFVDHVDLYI